MNTFPTLSFTPPPGPGERQKPRTLITVLAVMFSLFAIFGVLVIVGAIASDETDALLGLVFITLLGAGMGFLMFQMRRLSHYQEHPDHISFRAYPRKEVKLRYTDIQSATVQTSQRQRWAFLTDPQGKRHGIDLRSYNAPRLFAYLLTNAAEHLPPQRFNEEIAYLSGGFKIPLAQHDVDQLWQINGQKFANQQLSGHSYNNQPFNNQRFGNASGNAFGR